MKKLLPFLFLLAVTGCVTAATRITAVITVTNTPNGNTNTLTWNATSTRTWTNSVANAGTQIQTTNSIASSVTNLKVQLDTYKFQTWHVVSYGTNATTQVTVLAGTNEPIAITIAGLWASVTYITNQAYNSDFLMVPPRGNESNTFLQWQYSALATNLQRSTNPIINVQILNVGLSNVTATNFRAPGAGGVLSMQIGSNAYAGSNYSIALGDNSISLPDRAISLGVNASNTYDASASVTIRSDAGSTNTATVAIGRNALAGGRWSTAIGRQAKALYSNSMALGVSSQPTRAYQIMLGTITETVTLPGLGECILTFTTSNLVSTNVLLLGGSVSNVAVLQATAMSGILTALTNGFLMNTLISNAPAVLTTNLISYGGYQSNMIGDNVTITNLSVPGTGTASFQIGNSASASGQQSIVIGNNSTATNTGSMAVGEGAFSGGNGAVSVGSSSETYQFGDLAFGNGAVANGGNAIAIGIGAESDFTNSAAIGAGAISTTNNQVMLGTSSEHVYIPGQLRAVSQTNSVLRGTNVINGRVDFTSRANSALANGNNSGVILGTNVYIRLSGPSGAYTNAGFAAEQDGSFHILQFDNPVNNMTILNASGLDATAANRILTTTGGDLNFTNNPVMLQVLYDATASRWRLLNGMPYR